MFYSIMLAMSLVNRSLPGTLVFSSGYFRVKAPNREIVATATEVVHCGSKGWIRVTHVDTSILHAH